MNAPNTVIEEPQQDDHDQSESVYAWEIQTFPQRDIGSLSLAECHALVTKIWKQTLNLKADVPPISDGRGSSYARVYNETIHLPRWSRNRLIVIHELAHCVTSMMDHERSVAHDGLYMQVYLTILALEGDHKYDWLLKSAKDYGLKVSRADFHKRIRKFQDTPKS
jgi:hypothetical protein